MPSKHQHGAHTRLANSFRRSILSFRNKQVHSIEGSDSNAHHLVLESFEKQIFDRFHDLSLANADEFLSIAWIGKLLDAFIDCQEDFMFILCENRPRLSEPPLDKLLFEYFDRTIKALDICNSARDGIEKIRLWQRHLDIVLCALDSGERMMFECQFRRARKALMELALTMLDEKDTGTVFPQRNLSFGRQNKSKDHFRLQSGRSRSLSWSVSNSWSAARQVQYIANILVPPRHNDIAATNGLAVPVFTISFVQMFVLWILVVAIPCQGRSLQIHFSIPTQFSWGNPLGLIRTRIADEFKRRELESSVGMLLEIYQIEKCVHHITNLVDSAQFPLMKEQKEEVGRAVKELSLVYKTCSNGMEPFERHLREVFHKIMSCRTDGIEALNSTIKYQSG